MVRVRRSILYLFLMTLLFPVISLAVAPVSYLDPSFNRPYGYATHPTPYMLGERPNAVAIQRDGKIVDRIRRVADPEAEAEEKHGIHRISGNHGFLIHHAPRSMKDY